MSKACTALCHSMQTYCKPAMVCLQHSCSGWSSADVSLSAVLLQRRVRAAATDAAGAATNTKAEKGKGRGRGKQSADDNNKARYEQRRLFAQLHGENIPGPAVVCMAHTVCMACTAHELLRKCLMMQAYSAATLSA